MGRSKSFSMIKPGYNSPGGNSDMSFGKLERKSGVNQSYTRSATQPVTYDAPAKRPRTYNTAWGPKEKRQTPRSSYPIGKKKPRSSFRTLSYCPIGMSPNNHSRLREHRKKHKRAEPN